jgi:hypothetical protein
MTGRRDGFVMLVVLAGVAAGCGGPNFVDLSYQRGTYVHRVAPVRVGVYYLDDDRPGWPATAAMRMFDGTHGKGAGMRHTEGDKDVNVFVAESLRAELSAAGMKVSPSKQFNRTNEYATADGAKAASVDRVVMGHINYFGFVSPVPGARGAQIATGVMVGGIVGGVVAAKLSGQLEEVSPKAYVDIDLWVVEPSTGRILWGGTARGKFSTTLPSGVVADRVAVFLPDALHTALKEVVARSDFLVAMGATLLPTKARPQASAHEQNAHRLFQSERFAEASVEFQKAYQEGGDPALIFNAALCYRRSGDVKLAHAAFEEYLRQAPKAPPRPTVEARIKELRQQRAASRSGH